MNKRIKITLLELLVIAIFILISKFIKIDTFGFCMGAVYIMIFDVIENYFRGDK